MKNKYKFLLKLLIPVPFIIGVIGFRRAGFDYSDAFYGSFCYYFVSVYYAVAPNALMEIARWTAPLATASWLAVTFQSLWLTIHSYLVSTLPNAVAVYHDGDEEDASILTANMPTAFLVDVSDKRAQRMYPYAAHSVLMFKNDRSALDFYNRHARELSHSNVHIIFRTMDPIYIKSRDFQAFSVPHSTASLLWLEHPLIEGRPHDKRRYSVAIIGSEYLGTLVLAYALAYNIFYEDQEIEYHLFGDWRSFKGIHGDIPMMNKDSIIYHEEAWYDALDTINKMDRAVLVDKNNIHTLEMIMDYCDNPEILYYSEADESPARFYSLHSIYDFGTFSKLLTADNIINNHSTAVAKKMFGLRLHGSAEVVDDEWGNLDGKMVRAHVTQTNYFEMYSKLLAEGYALERDPQRIVTLEHIRWARTRSYAFWRYGVPDDGSVLDYEKRINSNLVPFEQLTDDAIQHHLDNINFLMDVFNKS